MIATRYRLDGPEIEFLRGRDFPHPSRSALEPTQPPIQRRVPGRFSRGQSSRGMALNLPPQSRAEVKERVELYFCSTSGPSLPVLGRN